jgi:hypothetical protein
MITVAQIVTTIISQKPFLAEALVEGIINTSSLARQIQQEVETMLQKPVQTGAIVMALKRFSPQIDLQTNIKFKKVFKGLGDIIVRSNLSDYTYKNSETLFEKHIQLLKRITGKEEIFYTFVQGVFESNFVISNSLGVDLEVLFKDEKIIASSQNLSSITLKLPFENISLPGFYYFILRKIAWEGINIFEVISTTNEFTIIVREQDVDRAFSVMKNLKN